MAYLKQKYSSSVDWVKTQQELLNIPQYPSFNPIYHQIKGFRRPFEKRNTHENITRLALAFGNRPQRRH